jgi:site-specific recombinase XerD
MRIRLLGSDPMSNELMQVSAGPMEPLDFPTGSVSAGAAAVAFATIPADRHPAFVYLAHLGAGSRRTMRGSLDTIAAIASGGKANAEGFPWTALRYQHTAAIRAALAERYRPATTNKMLAALRGVLHESFRLGLMDAETFQRSSDLPSIKAQTLPRGRALASGEIAALMRACADDAGPAGRRDAALVAVLYGAGLRRSEAVGLDLGDHNQETGELVVHGKGRKDRLGYAANGARDALEAWIAVRGAEPGALFVHVNKAGRVVVRRLTDQSVLHVLRKRAEEGAVAPFSPHDLRRTFISDLLDAGADIATAQHLAGHASVQTTALYDRRGEATKRRAAELLHVPYSKPRNPR